jgi:hypothetical protein
VGAALQPVRVNVEGEPHTRQGLAAPSAAFSGQFVVAETHQTKVVLRIVAPAVSHECRKGVGQGQLREST